MFTCFENGPVLSQFIGVHCSYDHNDHSTTLPTVAFVNLERVYYQVTEGNTMQVCAVVITPNINCPVAFSFEFNLSVGEGIVDTNEQAMCLIAAFAECISMRHYLSIMPQHMCLYVPHFLYLLVHAVIIVHVHSHTIETRPKPTRAMLKSANKGPIRMCARACTLPR